jgi:dihydroflavonol-4-reductase
LKNKHNITLVTGATGMLGARLIFDLIEKGETVRAIYRDPKRLKQFKANIAFYTPDAEQYFDKIEWVEADVLQYSTLFDALEGISVVYHCAAMVSFYAGDKKLMYETNINGTRNLVNACLERGVEWFCHVSSIAALGKTENGELINEETAWIPQKKHSGYSISKFHSEMEVWRGINEGLNAVIVNPSIILGPGDWSSGSPAFFDRIYKGLKFYTTGVTGYVDVQDVTKAMIALSGSLLRNEAKGKRFVINAENISYKMVFTLIAQTLGVKAPTIKAGRAMLAFAWRATWLVSKITGTKPMITRNSVQSATNISIFDGSKVSEVLGFNYRALDKTIKEYGEIYLKDRSVHQ